MREDLPLWVLVYIENLERTIDELRDQIRHQEVRSIIHDGLVTATADRTILN